MIAFSEDAAPRSEPQTKKYGENDLDEFMRDVTDSLSEILGCFLAFKICCVGDVCKLLRPTVCLQLAPRIQQ